MTTGSISELPEITLYRGSDQKIIMPSTVTIDGSAIAYESVGYLQLQYRAPDSTATPTRWTTDDGASRWDSSENAWLIPDSDSILTGSGSTTFVYDLHYVDASSNPTLVGRGGIIRVRDANTGLSA